MPGQQMVRRLVQLMGGASQNTFVPALGML